MIIVTQDKNNVIVQSPPPTLYERKRNAKREKSRALKSKSDR
jgi:hypothetical protein